MSEERSGTLSPQRRELDRLVSAMRSGTVGAQAGLGFLLVVILLLFSIVVPGFVGFGTLESFMFQLPVLGLLSLAMVVPLITGGLNLAIIATANQSALLMAFLMHDLAPIGGGVAATLGAIAIAMVAGLALCLVIGFLSGVLIAYTGVHPILVTLGTRSLIDGISIFLTRGRVLSGLPPLFSQIGNASLLGVPLIFLVLVFAALAIGIILQKTVFGVACAMIGSNLQAARYSAIDANRVLIGTYVLSSVACFVAALVMLVAYNSASADYARSYLLVTILAAVLGGVDPFGGFGTISGLMLALCVLQIVSTGFNQFGLSEYLTVAIWGGILIATVTLQTVGRSWLSKVTRRPSHTTG